MPATPVGPTDPMAVPRFAGLATFARLPQLDQVDGADVVVVGVPFDSGTTYRPGARFGPAHVRESSRLLRPYNPELEVGPFSSQQVADAGDIACNPFDIKEAVDQIEAGARLLARGGTRLVSVGGDHTIALPLLRVMAELHGPIAVLHFDAHLDTWDTYFGAPYTHGTPFRRASEEGLIDPRRSVHVGTRGPLYAASDLSETEELGYGVISCSAIDRLGPVGTAAAVRDRLGRGPVYVSVDIDVLDPAHAPGTGTPEAGGMTSRELFGLVRSLKGSEIVSADVVEVAPAYDHAQITGIAAAHITYELISLMALDNGRTNAEQR